MSKLVRFSIGYISTDKGPDTKFVRVIPIETSPQLDGVIDDVNATIQFEGLDEDGESFAGELISSAAIVAEWIGSDSQRMTPPNLKKGEVVVLYKYADEDRYFWESRNVKSHLRDTEHVVYMVAAKKEGDRSYLDITNSYTMVMSSRDQVISLNLTTANGEKSGFLLQLDGKNGKAFLMDTRGQQIVIEALLNRITLINKQKSKVVLDKENIDIVNKGNLTDTTDGTVSFTCADYKITASSFKADISGAFEVKAANVKFDAPTSVFTGMLQSGPLTCASLSVAPAPARAANYGFRMLGVPKAEAICKIVGGCDVDGGMSIINGDLNMNGGNITGVGSLAGNSASFSASCTAPNIK